VRAARFLVLVLSTAAFWGFWGTVSIPPAAAQEAQSAPCGFSDGFKALRDQLGPQTVGACLEAPRAVEGGDVHQRTERGLLVWRAATNHVAFTDGAQTWVSGPHGIQRRPNDQLFEWEEEALRAAEGPSARELALLYVETVRGETDVKLEHIYAVAHDMAAAQVTGWTDQARTRAGEFLQTTRSRLQAWLDERLGQLSGLGVRLRPGA
jgi:hypothetical protein